MYREDLEFFGLNDYNMESLLPKVSFFIEGNSDDMYRLIKKYEDKDWNHLEKALPWKNYSFGNGINVGTVISSGQPYPVSLSLSYCRIGDSLVCFYDCTSRCCDWTMIEDYLTTNYPVTYDDGSRRAMKSVENFHDCYHYCIDMYNSPFEDIINLELQSKFPDIDIEVKGGQIHIENRNLFGWMRKWIRDITIDRTSNKTAEEIAEEIAVKINSEYIPKLERFKEFKQNIENAKDFIDSDELVEFALNIEASRGKENLHEFSEGFKKCLEYISK